MSRPALTAVDLERKLRRLRIFLFITCDELESALDVGRKGADSFLIGCGKVPAGKRKCLFVDCFNRAICSGPSWGSANCNNPLGSSSPLPAQNEPVSWKPR